MSIKDRIAQFQGLSKNQPQQTTHTKPLEITKNTSPTTLTNTNPSKPQTTNVNTTHNSNQGNQVESPSIVKPSNAKKAWEAIAQNSMKQSPKKQAPSPTVKPTNVWPPPASNVSQQSSKPSVSAPEVKKNSVWPPPSTEKQSSATGNSSVVDAPVVKPNKVWPPPSANTQVQTKPVQKVTPVETKPNKVWPPPASTEPAQKPQLNKQGSLNHNALKQMFEGKAVGAMGGGGFNRMSFPVQSNSIIAKTQQQNTVKEAPTVGQDTVGSVKGNTQKLNRFFQAQRQYEKEKEEEKRKNAENTHSPPQSKTVVHQQNAHESQESSGISFLPGPGLSNPSPSHTQVSNVSPVQSNKQSKASVGEQQQSLMVRLKKKKRAKVSFSSSDSD